MGKVLVVASQKGGVGKTTLALNSAFALAKRGWRTLLIDADPQGSIGYSIQGDLHGRAGLAEVIEGTLNLTDAVVSTRINEFDILPVGRLVPTEAFAWSARLEEGSQLAWVLDQARALYDVVLVDTPPAMGGVTLAALRNAEYVVMPLQAEPLAARSVRHLLDVLGALRESGSEVQLAGLVLTMLQSREEASLAVAQESWRLFPKDAVFEASIPRDSAFLQASATGVPVALLQRRPAAVAAVFDQLAAELEIKIGLNLDDNEPIPLLG